MSATISHIAGRMALLLDRLERVRKSGRGYTARCPSHEDRSASLSIGEGNNGGIVVHCFAGCNPADVVQSVGLSLGDLFPERLRPETPEERRAFAQAMRETRWAAALDVLTFEAAVIQAAAGMLQSGEPLTPENGARLNLAVERVDNARQELKRGR
jgi:hypothetical protein